MEEGIEARNPVGITAVKVGVALSGSKRSKYLVRWALENFAKEHVMFELLHVRAKIISIPTPTGVALPVSQVRRDLVSVFEKETEQATTEMLTPYKKMFEKDKVQADILVLESENVATAICEAVSERRIDKLIIGASSSCFLIRMLRRSRLSLIISDKAPNFCTVYVVSKTKLMSTRTSEIGMNKSGKDDRSEISCWSTETPTTFSSSSLAETCSLGLLSPFRPLQRFRSFSTKNQKHPPARTPVEIKQKKSMSSEDKNEEGPMGIHQIGSGYATDSQTSDSYQDFNSTFYADSSSSGFQMNTDSQLERLKIELRHVQGTYAMTQTSIMDASQKLRDLNQNQSDIETQIEELNLKREAMELAKDEKERHIVATKEAEEKVKLFAAKETFRRQETVVRTKQETERVENNLPGPVEQCVKFTWEEIVAATSSFSESFKIGMGSYGSVYKCRLRNMTVAVKVVHTDTSNMTKQFQQELEILSKIRHQNLLLLLGACPERGCLVYEHMENGNLEERLFLSNSTSPLHWFDRYRVAWEVASALSFLHNTKPKSIIHRDLKPSNILLDQNMISKIGDVGLSKMLNIDPTSISTLHNATGPVGTLFYIDPEYQRTGVVSPLSDVYAFGIIVLQLVTAKPATGLALKVEQSIRNGKLMEVLDAKAGTWPVNETLQLVLLGLRCTELSRKDRPDLKTEVLPLLERLKLVADRAKKSFSTAESVPPSHFICPILQEIMKNPCVAADGYTYDRKAIEEWFKKNDRSPITNLPLLHMDLLPNYTILSAIKDWKACNNQKYVNPFYD